jgi:hypothetical protein
MILRTEDCDGCLFVLLDEEGGALPVLEESLRQQQYIYSHILEYRVADNTLKSLKVCWLLSVYGETPVLLVAMPFEIALLGVIAIAEMYRSFGLSRHYLSSLLLPPPSSFLSSSLSLSLFFPSLLRNFT